MRLHGETEIQLIINDCTLTIDRNPLPSVYIIDRMGVDYLRRLIRKENDHLLKFIWWPYEYLILKDWLKYFGAKRFMERRLTPLWFVVCELCCVLSNLTLSAFHRYGALVVTGTSWGLVHFITSSQQAHTTIHLMFWFLLCIRPSTQQRDPRIRKGAALALQLVYNIHNFRAKLPAWNFCWESKFFQKINRCCTDYSDPSPSPRHSSLIFLFWQTYIQNVMNPGVPFHVISFIMDSIPGT